MGKRDINEMDTVNADVLCRDVLDFEEYNEEPAEDTGEYD